ncbi:hypothetical protein [Tahibacter harae]|uniref:Lipoprotein n=1 Tax=Tahibacter harae TaxID=2963937 RepID=A0ABT1QYZ1_9GAMM|nr:hypothetical protein [Tahibacter harae]MCQ4167501.1 hypothetical protein [Tahibacter harae]
MRPWILFAALALTACDRPPEPAAPASGEAAKPAKPKRLPGDGVRVRAMAPPAELAQAQPAAPSTPPAQPAPRAPQPDSPKLEKLRAGLEQAGFGDLREKIDWSEVEEEYADAAALLQAAGLCVWFDVETGMFPNEHDGLLRQLAAAAGDDLAGVLFQEIPPTEDGDQAEAPYQLHAYADGKRWSVTARNYGDWYDVDAVLRLGNALLRDRGSAKRMLLLFSEDQTAQVVVAPQAVLGAALEQGLLQAGDEAAAREAGKAFEQEVLEKLKAERGAERAPR